MFHNGLFKYSQEKRVTPNALGGSSAKWNILDECFSQSVMKS